MDVLSLGLMNVKKINRFLWSTKKDAHKKICSFFLPHNVYDISNNWNLQTSVKNWSQVSAVTDMQTVVNGIW